jgi:hypothetical protein
MADGNTGGGSNGFLAFLVGALVVAVLGLGYMFYNGGIGGTEKHDFNLKIETPDIPKPSLPEPAPTPAPNN